MNLDYYYNYAGLDSGDITAIWRYDYSTGTYPKSIDYNGSGNFSIFLTIEKTGSSKSQILSNVPSGSGNGFLLGTTDNNQIFIETESSGVSEGFVFKKIPLAKKNTLLLKRIGNSFTIYDYDIVSQKIRESESYNFNPYSNINNSGLYVGGTYKSGLYGNINSKIDQFLMISGVCNSEDDETILKGFTPESTISTSQLYKITDSNDGYSWVDSISISGADYANIKGFYYDLNDSFKLLSGKYMGYFSGYSSGGSNFVSGYFVNKIDDCVGSGIPTGYSYSSAHSGANFTFNDSVSFESSGGRQLVNHSVKFDSYSGYGNNFYISHYFNNLWEYSDVTVYGTIDTGYFSGFKMNGVYSERNSGIILLSTNNSCAPTGIGLESDLDKIYDSFPVIADSLNYAYIDGVLDEGFSISNRKFFASKSGDKLIYDLSSGADSFVTTSTKRFVSGNFDKYGSIVHTSVNSWSQFNRIGLNSDYREVSEYDLLFAKDFKTQSGLTRTYNNQEDNWQ